MRSILLLLAAPALLSASARESSGVGDYQPSRYIVLRVAHAPPLSEIGENVLRFSRSPALGGRGYIFEMHAADRDWAEGQVRLFYGGRGRWKPVGAMPVILRRAEYDALTARVDAALSRGEPPSVGPKGEIMVCTDGPGYVTERRRAGTSRWLSGFCGADHPNNEIAPLVEAVMGRQLGAFFER